MFSRRSFFAAVGAVFAAPQLFRTGAAPFRVSAPAPLPGWGEGGGIRLITKYSPSPATRLDVVMAFPEIV
jgi:hypothetical protein